MDRKGKRVKRDLKATKVDLGLMEESFINKYLKVSRNEGIES